MSVTEQRYPDTIFLLDPQARRETPTTPDLSSHSPDVSVSDVSGSDVSGSDVSGSDASGDDEHLPSGENFRDVGSAPETATDIPWEIYTAEPDGGLCRLVAPDNFRQRLVGSIAGTDLVQRSAPSFRDLPAAEPQFLRSRAERYAEQALRQAHEQNRIASREPGAAATALKLGELEVKVVLGQGLDHLVSGVPCQDALCFARSHDAVVVGLSDGASAARLAHLGAELICLDAVTIAMKLLVARQQDSTPDRSIVDVDFLAALHVELYLRLSQVVREVHLPIQLAYQHLFAATLQLLVITPRESVVLALGDGYIRCGGQTFSITGRLERAPQLAELNHPPCFFCSVAFDQGASSLFEEHEDFLDDLHQEALAFHIVAAGPTRDFLTEPVVMASDGGRFTAEFSHHEKLLSSLPLGEVATALGAMQAWELVLLYNVLADDEEEICRLRSLQALLRLPVDSLSEQAFAFVMAVRNLLRQRFLTCFPGDPDLRALLTGEWDVAETLETLSFSNGERRYALLETRSGLLERIFQLGKLIWEAHSGALLPGSAPWWDDVSAVIVSRPENATETAEESAAAPDVAVAEEGGLVHSASARLTQEEIDFSAHEPLRFGAELERPSDEDLRLSLEDAAWADIWLAAPIIRTLPVTKKPRMETISLSGEDWPTYHQIIASHEQRRRARRTSMNVKKLLQQLEIDEHRASGEISRSLLSQIRDPEESLFSTRPEQQKTLTSLIEVKKNKVEQAAFVLPPGTKRREAPNNPRPSRKVFGGGNGNGG